MALWLLCACGRIGYDEMGGMAPFDASVVNFDGSTADVAVSPGADASQDRPVAVGDGGGEASTESDGTFVDGASAADQGGVSTDAASCGSGPVALLHWNVSPSSTGPLDLEFKVTNRTGQTIPISSLKLRYYLTSEFTAPTLSTYFTEVCCGAPRTGFGANMILALYSIASPTKPTASSFIEMGFDSGAGMLVDGDTVKLEIGLVGNGQVGTQTNDYSYLATASGTQKQWDQCPAGPGGPSCAKYVSCVTDVYKDGILVWGTPP